MSNLTDRLIRGVGKQRDSAIAHAEYASNISRNAAAATRRGISTTYEAALDRADDLIDRGRETAALGVAATSRMATRSRSVVDRATFVSRELITDRPLAALAIGIGGGIVLGFLANRLGQAWADRRAEADVSDDDDERFTDY